MSEIIDPNLKTFSVTGEPNSKDSNVWEEKYSRSWCC